MCRYKRKASGYFDGCLHGGYEPAKYVWDGRFDFSSPFVVADINNQSNLPGPTPISPITPSATRLKRKIARNILPAVNKFLYASPLRLSTVLTIIRIAPIAIEIRGKHEKIK